MKVNVIASHLLFASAYCLPGFFSCFGSECKTETTPTPARTPNGNTPILQKLDSVQLIVLNSFSDHPSWPVYKAKFQTLEYLKQLSLMVLNTKNYTQEGLWNFWENHVLTRISGFQFPAVSFEDFGAATIGEKLTLEDIFDIEKAMYQAAVSVLSQNGTVQAVSDLINEIKNNSISYIETRKVKWSINGYQNFNELADQVKKDSMDLVQKISMKLEVKGYDAVRPLCFEYTKPLITSIWEPLYNEIVKKLESYNFQIETIDENSESLSSSSTSLIRGSIKNVYQKKQEIQRDFISLEKFRKDWFGSDLTPQTNAKLARDERITSLIEKYQPPFDDFSRPDENSYSVRLCMKLQAESEDAIKFSDIDLFRWYKLLKKDVTAEANKALNLLKTKRREAILYEKVDFKKVL